MQAEKARIPYAHIGLVKLPDEVSDEQAILISDIFPTGYFGADIAEIEEGHKSTLLCHLGNIAYRNGRTLNCDPANGKILDDVESMALWSRDYEKGWEVEV